MLFSGPLHGSRLTSAARRTIRFLRDDVAVVIGTGGASLDGGPTPEPGRASVVSFVVTRAEDSWSIAFYQNTRIGRLPAAAR